MKSKTLLTTIMLIFIAIFLPIAATAGQNAEEITAWVDSAVRKPDDPPYLSLHYRLRTLYFSVDPSPDHPVVFLGDSITYGGDWSALFPESPVENRGIGGDTTLGLLNRLDQIIAIKPAKVFLMIGTNDLCYGRPIPKIMENYRIILNRFHAELPNTPIYIQSFLPFNDILFPARGLRSNSEIRKLNIHIQALAKEFGYPYLDLSLKMANPDGLLPVEYTSDGLHLSDKAYLVWRENIKSLVN